MNHPLVSVLMSVYNAERFLTKAIESILNQSYHNFEFIIIDDHSTDSSTEICEHYSRQDSRIKFYKNAKNHGLTKSLNIALSKAEGKYIARMDADDISLSERFVEQISFLESNLNIGLIGTNYSEIDAKGEITSDEIIFYEEPIVIAWRLCFENPIPHPPILVRKDLLDKVGGYDERWDFAMDYALFTQLAAHTRLSNQQKVLFYWRVHNTSISSTKKLQQRANAMAISHEYINTLASHSISDMQIELLWDRDLTDFSNVRKLFDIMYKLYRNIVKQKKWSKKDKTILKKHVANKLFSYIRPNLNYVASWGLLLKLSLLHPHYIISRALKFSFGNR